MKNENFGKYLSFTGKVIAAVGGILAISHVIPGDGFLIWGAVIIGGFMIILGNKFEQE